MTLSTDPIYRGRWWQRLWWRLTGNTNLLDADPNHVARWVGTWEEQ